MSVMVYSQVQVAVCVASILLSTIVVAVALLLYLKHRHRALLHFAIFLGLGVWTGGLSFLGGMGWRPSFAVGMALSVTVLPTVAGLSISLALFVRSLLSLQPPRWMLVLVWLPAPALLLSLGILIATIPRGLGTLGRVHNLLVQIGFSWFFLTWIVSFLVVIVGFRRITQPEVRKGLRLMALVMAAWIPFWVAEVLTRPSPLMSPFYFALIWTLLSLGLAVRHFFQPPKAREALSSPGGPLADASMLDRFATTRKLTPRERELLGLLVEDLNHAGIAEKLFISEKTVRNHVSNIYTKVGVSSRLELIQAIRAR